MMMRFCRAKYTTSTVGEKLLTLKVPAQCCMQTPHITMVTGDSVCLRITITVLVLRTLTCGLTRAGKVSCSGLTSSSVKGSLLTPGASWLHHLKRQLLPFLQ